MPLLSSNEAVDVTDAFLYTLYGDETFYRWKELKEEMKFDAERDYVKWVLDIVHHYQLKSGNGRDMKNVDQSKRVAKNNVPADFVCKTETNNTVDGSGEVNQSYEEDGDGEWGEPDGGDDDDEEHMIEQLKEPQHYMPKGLQPPPGVIPESSRPSAETVAALLEDGAGGGIVLGPSMSGGVAIRKFACRYQGCNYMGKRKDSLKQHISNMHHRRALVPCTLCSYKAKKGNSLMQHMILKHDQPSRHTCDKCNKPFISPLQLARHIKKCTGPKLEKEEDKKYMCDQCAFRTAHKPSLLRHVQYVHEDAELHCCMHCDYVSPRKSNYKQHLITKHRYESAYKCDICSKPLSSQSKLESHREACMAKLIPRRSTAQPQPTPCLQSLLVQSTPYDTITSATAAATIGLLQG